MNSVFAIPLSGTIEHNSKLTNFAISLREDYMNYLEFISIELKDNYTAKKYSCDMSFIGVLEKDTIYDIKLNYFDDDLVCVLMNTRKMSKQTLEMKKKMSKPMKLSDLPKDIQEKFQKRTLLNNQ